MTQDELAERLKALVIELDENHYDERIVKSILLTLTGAVYASEDILQDFHRVVYEWAKGAHKFIKEKLAQQ